LVILTPQGGISQAPSATAWRELTLADVEAAHSIIARNHPAASPRRLRLGPFEPHVLYPGRMDDTRGLEEWISRLVTSRS